MTENMLLIVIASILGFIQEIVLHKPLVLIKWKDEMSFARRLVIAWPILSFLIYGLLLVSYVMFFEHYPQGFKE